MSAAKNYRNYIDGKEPLKYAILPFEDDKMQEYVTGEVKRNLWVTPPDQLHAWQKRLRKKNTK